MRDPTKTLLPPRRKQQEQQNLKQHLDRSRKRQQQRWKREQKKIQPRLWKRLTKKLALMKRMKSEEQQTTTQWMMPQVQLRKMVKWKMKTAAETMSQRTMMREQRIMKTEKKSAMEPWMRVLMRTQTTSEQDWKWQLKRKSEQLQWKKLKKK
jgi:hypothetical protein